jgi:hypothetical protein
MWSEINYKKISVENGFTIFNKLFLLCISYYWLLRFTTSDLRQVISEDLSYYIYIVPSAAFGLFGILYVIMTQSKFLKIPKILILFTIVVSIVSIARNDFNTLFTVGLMSIGLITLFQVRPKISINFINIIFLISIFINTILFIMDFSIYTFIPGISSHPYLPWRISVYPSVAQGALFAMIVFLANFSFRSYRYRIPMIVVSGYMLLLSGVRTGLIAAAAGSLYAALCHSGALQTRLSRMAFLYAAVVFFVFSIFFSDLLMLLPFADNAVFQALIFRDEGIKGFELDGQVSTAAVREWIMAQHFSAFLQSPFIGVGTFEFANLSAGGGILANSGTTGSEAFVTALFARIGLLAVPFFAALFFVRLPLGEEEEVLSTAFKISLMFGMLTYGSFVNIYDIVFLLLILGIAGCIKTPERMKSA